MFLINYDFKKLDMLILIINNRRSLLKITLREERREMHRGIVDNFRTEQYEWSNKVFPLLINKIKPLFINKFSTLEEC